MTDATDRPPPLALPPAWLAPYSPTETICVVCSHSRGRHYPSNGFRCGVEACRCECFTTANPS